MKCAGVFSCARYALSIQTLRPGFRDHRYLQHTASNLDSESAVRPLVESGGITNPSLLMLFCMPPFDLSPSWLHFVARTFEGFGALVPLPMLASGCCPPPRGPSWQNTECGIARIARFESLVTNGLGPRGFDDRAQDWPAPRTCMGTRRECVCMSAGSRQPPLRLTFPSLSSARMCDGTCSLTACDLRWPACAPAPVALSLRRGCNLRWPACAACDLDECQLVESQAAACGTVWHVPSPSPMTSKGDSANRALQISVTTREVRVRGLFALLCTPL
jgi:hypothetical protein